MNRRLIKRFILFLLNAEYFNSTVSLSILYYSMVLTRFTQKCFLAKLYWVLSPCHSKQHYEWFRIYLCDTNWSITKLIFNVSTFTYLILHNIYIFYSAASRTSAMLKFPNMFLCNCYNWYCIHCDLFCYSLKDLVSVLIN